MPKQSSAQIEQKHEHRWSRTTQVEYRCVGLYKGSPCRCIKIGPEEFERRVGEYNNYHELLRTTQSFLDWQDMSRAFKAKDLEMMKEIKERISKRVKQKGWDSYGEKLSEFNEEAYLDKPEFSDPYTPFLYVVEGV